MKTNRAAALLAAITLVLWVVLPATAFAAGDRHRDEHIDCVITLFVVDPGSDEVRLNGEEHRIKNSGQMTEGSIDCFEQRTRERVPQLSGAVVTKHGSTVLWDSESGAFEGDLAGAFSLTNAQGEVRHGALAGIVAGTAVVLPPGFIDGFPDARVVPSSELIRGVLKLDMGGSRFEARFEIGLVGVGFGLGELAGSASGILGFRNG